MYIFINQALDMSQGKVAAQAAHAAVEAYRISTTAGGTDPIRNPLVQAWYVGGHYTKLVMAARDETHLRTIQEYLKARDFNSVLIIDEGRTEIAPHTATALGVPVVDKDDEHTAATFGGFKTLRPKKVSVAPPQPPNMVKGSRFGERYSNFLSGRKGT